MATPTAGEINTTLANGVKPTSDLIADFPTIVTSIDTAEQALEGDFQPAAVVGALAEQRGLCSAAISPDLLRRHWSAWMLERFRLAGRPQLNPRTGEAWVQMHRILHDASETFNDRDLTVPTNGTAGGSNVGNSTLEVLGVDWEGYNLQLPHSETKTWECVRDQNTGVLKNAEVFQVRGEDASKDFLDETGSGIVTQASVMHAGQGSDGASRLQNSSFDSAFNGSSSTKIPGWTITGTAGDVTEETANVFRTEPGVSTSRSLEIAAGSGTIAQALSLQRLSAIGETVPWMLQVAVKKTAGGDTGTLTLHMGSKSQAFDLSTYNNTGWNILQLDRDKDLYYRNWKEDAADIKVQWASTSDVIWVDGLIFAPMTWIDGLWWWLAPGGTNVTHTAFLARDTFAHAVSGGTWANAELMNSLRWAARSGGRWGAGLPVVNLPVATSGAETISDP